MRHVWRIVTCFRYASAQFSHRIVQVVSNYVLGVSWELKVIVAAWHLHKTLRVTLSLPLLPFSRLHNYVGSFFSMLSFRARLKQYTLRYKWCYSDATGTPGVFVLNYYVRTQTRVTHAQFHLGFNLCLSQLLQHAQLDFREYSRYNDVGWSSQPSTMPQTLWNMLHKTYPK